MIQSVTEKPKTEEDKISQNFIIIGKNSTLTTQK